MAIPGVHTIRYLPVSTASSGDTALVAAVGNARTGKRVTVLGYALVADSAVDVKFKDGSTDITGALGLGANGGVSYAGGADAPAFQTSRGAALNINLGGAVQVSGHIAYIEE